VIDRLGFNAPRGGYQTRVRAKRASGAETPWPMTTEEVTSMATPVVPVSRDRHTYNSSGIEGLTFRWLANGSKKFYGYIPGRGRVPLSARKVREARAEWDELRGKAGRGEKIAPRNVRFGVLAEEWFESKKDRLRPWTLNLYRMALDRYVLPRFGHRKLADIDVQDVAKFIRHLEEQGLSSSSIESYLLPLKGTLAFACRRRLLTANPCDLLTADDRPVKRERRKAFEWSDEQIEALLAASELLARQPSARFDYSPLIRTAVHTGLRLGELLGLQWGDLELDEAVLHVRRQLSRTGELTPPKTAKALRRVPLSADMVAFLRRLKLASQHSQDGDFVFSSRKGGPLSHRNVQRRAFGPARDLAELTETLTFHDLRHAFASYATHRGVPMNVLSEIMGHTNIAVTAKVYVHLYGRPAAEEAFRAAMAW
jgi:integrase